MIKLKNRFDNFSSILEELESAIFESNLTKLQKAGVIQYFEITFELTWKMLKDYLFYLGFDLKSPREVLKKSYEIGIIDDIDTFLKMLADRNTTTHIYNEELAEEIFERIKFDYLSLLINLKEKINEIISKRD